MKIVKKFYGLIEILWDPKTRLSAFYAFRNLFYGFFIGYLRGNRGDVLVFDRLVDFVPVNRNMSGGFDSETNVISANTKYLDFDLVSYNQLLVFFPRHNKHKFPLVGSISERLRSSNTMKEPFPWGTFP